MGVDEDGDGTPESFLQLENELTGTGAEGDPTGGVPEAYGLAQNYPNPFAQTSTIAYALPEPGKAPWTFTAGPLPSAGTR